MLRLALTAALCLMAATPSAAQQQDNFRHRRQRVNENYGRQMSATERERLWTIPNATVHEAMQWGCQLRDRPEVNIAYTAEGGNRPRCC